MNINSTASKRSVAVSRGTRARSIFFGLCVLGLAAAANAHEPRIITFDAPGAGTAPGQGTGCAYSDCSVVINNFGEITGYYLDANNVFHGFARSPQGKITTFDVPGADLTAGDFNGTLPNAINDAGAITGEWFDANNQEHGFLRSPDGKFTTFDVTGGTIGTTNPIALNLEGAIVGYSLDANGAFQGFLRRPEGTFETWSGPGACTDTPANGCYGTAAFSINILGTVAGGYHDNKGNFVDHGLLRRANGKFTTFDAPGAGTGPNQGTGSPGTSRPLNQFGATASYYTDANNLVHGYLRSPDGKITTFDIPGQESLGIGCYADCSIGLNDSGAITGYYLDVNNVYHGFLRTPAGKVTTFDVPGADLTPGDYNGTFPVSINDRGEIAGYYWDINNVIHGFLLLPSDRD
jgi:hypothetical protein